MTIKATAALSILAIWAAMIPAIVVHPHAWWSLIFAFLATCAIGVSAWRRLGLSRLIAIAGTWAGTAVAIAADSANAWVAIFAFLTTAVVVYSIMRRDAVASGLGIAAAWLVVGGVLFANDDPGGAWINVFAFLTAAAIANNRLSNRGLGSILWWCLAGAA